MYWVAVQELELINNIREKLAFKIRRESMVYRRTSVYVNVRVCVYIYLYIYIWFRATMVRKTYVTIYPPYSGDLMQVPKQQSSLHRICCGSTILLQGGMPEAILACLWLALCFTVSVGLGFSPNPLTQV